MILTSYEDAKAAINAAALAELDKNMDWTHQARDGHGRWTSGGGTPLDHMMNSFEPENEAKQRSSGLWGPNRTAAEHDKDVNALSPSQRDEYVKQIARMVPMPSALATARSAR